MKKQTLHFLFFCLLALYSVSASATCTPATALHFKGPGDFNGGNINTSLYTYVSVPSSTSLRLQNTYSIEAWIYMDDSVNNTIVDKGNYDFLFQARPNGQRGLGLYNSNMLWVYSAGVVPDHQWVHVAVTFDAIYGQVVFYMNGNVLSTHTVAQNGSNIINGQVDNTIMTIGRQSPTSCSCNNMDGKIDELRIWNRVRCQAEIQASMNCELSATGQTGLAALYHFNQGCVGASNAGLTTATDASGNNNNGTLVNFTLAGDTSNWSTGNVSGTCSAPALPSASISTPNTTLCGSAADTFTAAPINAGTPSYQWYLNGTAVGTNSATYIAATINNNDSVWVVMTPSTACGKDTSNHIKMTVNQPTSASRSVNICSSSLPYIHGTHSLTAAGADTIHLTNSVGCDSTDIVVLIIISSPSPTLTTSGTCTGTDSLSLSVPVGVTSVSWYNGASLAATTLASYMPSTAAGGNNQGSAANQLSSPQGLYVDGSGNIYVADAFNHRIQKFPAGSTSTTNGVTVAGGNGSGSAANQLSYPTGVYVDGSGNIYVVDGGNNRIQKFPAGSNSATNGVTMAGGNGSGSAANQLHSPAGVYLDGSGNIFIVDYSNHRIQKFPVGSTSATNGVTVAGGNGQGSAANQLNFPHGIYVDGSSNIYVADGSNNRVQKFPAGSTSATNGVTVAGGNGSGSTANQLSGPTGVYVDVSGNIYIADNGNHRIQKFPSGSTSATNGVTVGGGNGYGSAANQLNYPFGVSLDSSGRVYTADGNNNRIQKLSPITNYTYKPLSAGSYTATVTNAVGCSATAGPVVYTAPLVPGVSISAAHTTICSGSIDSFTATAINGGTAPTYRWYKNGTAISGATAATYTITTLSNNDSLWVTMTSNASCASRALVSSNHIKVSVVLPTSSITNLAICAAALPYTWNGLTFTAAGTQTAHLTNSVGCDSAATLILTITPTSTSTTSLSICQSALPFVWNGLTFSVGGTQTAHLTNSVGCDSAATLTLTINPTSTSTSSLSICPSALPFVWNGLTFTAGGTQTAHLTNSVGCDSAATLTLTIKATSTSSTSLTICSSTLPYAWNGLTFTASGTQTAHLTNSVGCDSAATLILTANPCGATVWTGTTSTAWGIATNWSNGLPSCSQDAVIAAAANQPVISAAASVQNLTINSGATLTINTGITLSVCGSLADAGTSLLGAGNVKLQGATGTITGRPSFNNLEIAGNYTVGGTAADTLFVRGILKKTSGTLTTTDKLVMRSTAAQTALIQENGGNLTGNATIERFITGISGFHQMSSPVSGALLSSMTGSGVTQTGINGVAHYITPGTVLIYKEPVNAYNTIDSGYYSYINPTNPLTSTLGISVKTYAGLTMKFYGPPTVGNFNTNITKLGSNTNTAGWNLIGNPYPSPMSWTALKNANAGQMYGSCYIWKQTTGTAGIWQTYNGTAGVNGVGDVISESQGFFIQKLNAGTSTLSFADAMRTQTLTAVFYKNNNAQPDEIRLSLSNADMSTEALAYTEAGRSDAFDADVDAILPSIDGMSGTSITFVPRGEKYMIHVTEAITESTEIPVAIHTVEEGTYNISATSLYVDGLPVYLFDKMTGSYTDLSRNDLTIRASANEDNNNYSVVFSKSSAVRSNAVNIYGKEGAIAITRSDVSVPAQVAVYNLLGQQVASAMMSTNNIELPVNISGAIYMVSVKQNGAETIQKVLVR